jgi:hypothetical protein
VQKVRRSETVARAAASNGGHIGRERRTKEIPSYDDEAKDGNTLFFQDNGRLDKTEDGN